MYISDTINIIYVFLLYLLLNKFIVILLEFK